MSQYNIKGKKENTKLKKKKKKKKSLKSHNFSYYNLEIFFYIKRKKRTTIKNLLKI